MAIEYKGCSLNVIFMTQLFFKFENIWYPCSGKYLRQLAWKNEGCIYMLNSWNRLCKIGAIRFFAIVITTKSHSAAEKESFSCFQALIVVLGALDVWFRVLRDRCNRLLKRGGYRCRWMFFFSQKRLNIVMIIHVNNRKLGNCAPIKSQRYFQKEKTAEKTHSIT